MNRILIPVLSLALCGAAIAQTVPGQLQARLANVEAKAAAGVTAAAAAQAAADTADTVARAATNTLADASLAAIVAYNGVISRTGSILMLDYGANTNGGTIAWSVVFGGTPSVSASYWGNVTNASGLIAAAQVSTANSTNCVVVGDAADTAAFIYVTAVGVAP